MLVIHAHLHRRRTGVTTHTESVARAQSAHTTVRIFGGGVDPALPRLGFFGLLAAARKTPVVFHAHRNVEIVAALLLRVLLGVTGARGSRFALVATRHGGGRPSWITRALLRRADRVIALTGVARGLLPVASEIVGHGVELSRFHPPAEPSREFEALGLPRTEASSETAPIGIPNGPSSDAAAAPTSPVTPTRAIGVVGRVRPAKGQGDFARAIAPLLPSHPDWTAVVVGLAKGRDASFAQQLVAETDGRLHLLGERADPAPVFRALTVVVQPSHAESYSLVLLEAMASGCCVIAAGLPHYSELLVDGVTALTYPVGDVAALRDRLAKVMEDPTLAVRIGSAAAAHAREHFGIEREASALLGIYTAALSQRSQTTS